MFKMKKIMLLLVLLILPASALSIIDDYVCTYQEDPDSIEGISENWVNYDNVFDGNCLTEGHYNDSLGPGSSEEIIIYESQMVQ